LTAGPHTRPPRRRSLTAAGLAILATLALGLPAASATADDVRSTGALKTEVEAGGTAFTISPKQVAAAEERLDGIPSALVVLDPADGRVLARLGGDAAAQRMPPCSTFKVPNTLIALEEGAVSLDDHAIPRDRERIPDDDWRARGRWAEDQDLRSALRYSTVWYFQEVARRVGGESMAEWLERFDYGNRDISGGIDTFWLGSSLRISADEQAAFLARLVRGELPVDEGHVELLEEGIRRDGGEDGTWTWYGKTGSCQSPPMEDVAPGKSYGDFPDDTPWVGWLVGWVERDEWGSRPLVYAYRVDATDYDELKARRDPLIQPLLTDLGLLPRSE